MDTIAQDIVKKNSFTLSAKLDKPLLVNMYFPGAGKTIVTFLDNASINISGDTASFGQLKITGSATHNEFQVFQSIFNPLYERLIRTNQQMQLSGQTDSLLAASKSVIDEIQQQIDIFINNHKSSPVSAFLIAVTYQLKDDVLLADARVNKLDSSAMDNLYGAYVRQQIAINKPTAIGAIAADFSQADTSGHPVSLSSFRGKYVLVDFWASWCGPCRMENPNVVENYNKFKKKNFTVLGVSLDRPGQKQKWIEAIHTDNLAWTHVSDLQYWNNAVAKQYNIESIPQNFLIGPDGKIVAKNLRGPALEQKLCEVLGCN
jgi:peroxiredoxin